MIGIHFVFYADDVLSFFIRIFVKEDKIKILCIKKIMFRKKLQFESYEKLDNEYINKNWISQLNVLFWSHLILKETNFPLRVINKNKS